MLKPFFRTVTWLAILFIGIGLIAFSFFIRDAKNPEPTTPALTGLSPATTSPSTQSTFSPTPQKVVNGTRIATCQLRGSIKFINNNLYETKGAKIAYQNVDDRIRQIYWQSNPDDEALTVGPNLFEQLIIPTGEHEVGVTLQKNTEVKLYTLTAAVSYGVELTNGREEVKKANCTGTITVTLP